MESRLSEGNNACCCMNMAAAVELGQGDCVARVPTAHNQHHSNSRKTDVLFFAFGGRNSEKIFLATSRILSCRMQKQTSFHVAFTLCSAGPIFDANAKYEIPIFKEEIAHKIGPSKIDIAYQRTGREDAPAVMMIMGVASQSIHWPESFCRDLVDRGLQLIRFDNRDSGLSTYVTAALCLKNPLSKFGSVISFSAVRPAVDLSADSHPARSGHRR
jgi:hypothetical protein